MKKLLPLGLLIAAVAIFYGFNTINAQDQSNTSGETIEWYSWEEAVKMNETDPKKIIVDVYTDWCGWCKVMDKKTFTDPAVIKLMNKHFYAVKLDAEQKEDIHFQGNVFKYVGQGRRGANEFAVSLLDSKMSFPSIVYLADDLKRITVSPGYKKPDQMIKELSFIGGNHYKTTSFDAYSAE